MNSMDLLPGLTKGQIEFAYRYYPIFEDLKGAILALAGISIMQQGQAADQGYAVFQDGLTRVNQDLSTAIRLWSEFAPMPAQREDYQLVAQNLHKLVEIVSQQKYTSLAGALQDSVLDDLLQAYTALRRLALRYWRLELVAESGHIH